MLKTFTSRAVAIGIILAFSLSMTPFLAKAQETNTGNLFGYVYKKNAKNPMENAVVNILNTMTAEEFSSKPTDTSGRYDISSIPEGTYQVRVFLGGKNYFQQDIMIKIEKDQTIEESFIVKGRTTLLGAILKCPALWILAAVGIYAVAR